MMDQKQVKNIFHYDSEKGGLIYKVQPFQSKSKAGQLVGSKCRGRLFVRVNKKLYAVHRLVFLFHRGFWPEQVDHIDGNGLNNKIENLRAATNAENQRNKPKLKHNKSGFKGIHFCKQTKSWRVQITFERKRICGGRFSTKKEAAKKYNQLAKKYHNEFANINKLGGNDE